jgi:hypothetical protein
MTGVRAFLTVERERATVSRNKSQGNAIIRAAVQPGLYLLRNINNDELIQAGCGDGNRIVVRQRQAERRRVIPCQGVLVPSAIDAIDIEFACRANGVHVHAQCGFVNRCAGRHRIEAELEVTDAAQLHNQRALGSEVLCGL